MFEFQSSNFLVECFKSVSSRENINFVKKKCKRTDLQRAVFTINGDQMFICFKWRGNEFE